LRYQPCGEELWRPIVNRFWRWNFPNYEISDRGRVRNINTGHILKTDLLKSGQKRVVIQRDKYDVAKLVCGIFNGNPPDRTFRHVHFLNKQVSDVSPSNLQWNQTFQKGLITREKKQRVVTIPGEVWNSHHRFNWEISSHGRVRLADSHRIIEQRESDGYVFICKPKLERSAKEKKWPNTVQFVHRMVAETFLARKKGCNVVDHINGNKKDNRSINLRWATHQQNRINPATKWKLEKPVRQLSLDGMPMTQYPSIEEASRLTGVCSSSISGCCRGAQK